MKKKLIRLTESDLHRIVKESVKSILKETKKTSLRNFMKLWYDDDDSCIDAVGRLTDNTWLRSMGWEQVFHEGTGDGVYSPEEGIVAVFDEDELPEFHGYQLYKYDPKVWKSCNGNGLDKIYNGDNGDRYDAEAI
jgi:hypothetical protein